MSAAITVLGHADRPVTITVVAGRAVAVKAYNDDRAAQVFDEMSALWNSAFGAAAGGSGSMPEPISRDLATGELVMSLLDGDAVGSRGELGRTPHLVVELAELLARLHGRGVRCSRQRTNRRILRSLARKVPDLAAPLQWPFEQAMVRLSTELPDDEPLVISHGDFSPRNVIETVDGLGLIDFDRLQMAPRGRDVAYLGAWSWATEALAGKRASWTVGNRFAESYGRVPGVDPEWRNTLAGHRAAALLRIAHGWSVLRSRPELALLIIGEAAHQLRLSEVAR